MQPPTPFGLFNFAEHGMASVTATNPEPPPVAVSFQDQQFIERQLRAAGVQVKLFDLGVSLLLLAIGVLGFFLTAAVVDHWIMPLGLVGRCTALLLVVAGIAAWVAMRIRPLVRGKINPLYAARAIETNSSGLKNSLINFLLLRRDGQALHPRVLEAVGRQAATDLTHVPVEQVVDRRPLLRLAAVLGGLFVLFAAYKLLSPKDPFPTIARVLAPWADIAAPTRSSIEQIEPGDIEVYRGRQFTVSAVGERMQPGDVLAAYYSSADGRIVDRRVLLQAAAEGPRRSAEMPETGGLEQDITYHLRIENEAGTRTYARSRDFSATVLPAPDIFVHRVEYEFPPYTRLTPTAEEGTGQVEALEGTRVTLHARANQPLRSAYVELSTAGSEPDPRNALPMEVEGSEARVRFTLQRNGGAPKYTRYQVHMIAEDGARNEEPIVYSVNVIPDLPPVVEIIEPSAPRTELAADARLKIEIRAADPDFELSRVVLHASHNGLPLLEQQLLGETSLRSFEFSPRRLELRPGDAVEVWATAADNRTAPLSRQPEPNETSTAKVTIVITPPKSSAGEDPQNGGSEENPENGGNSEEGGSEGSEGENGGNNSEEGGAEDQAGMGTEGEAGNEQGMGQNSENENAEGEPGEQSEGGNAGGEGEANPEAGANPQSGGGEGEAASGGSTSAGEAGSQQGAGSEGSEGENGGNSGAEGNAERGSPSDSTNPGEAQPGGTGAGEQGFAEPQRIDPDAQPGDAIEKILKHRDEQLARGEAGSGDPQGTTNAEGEAIPGESPGQTPPGEAGNERGSPTEGAGESAGNPQSPADPQPGEGSGNTSPGNPPEGAKPMPGNPGAQQNPGSGEPGGNPQNAEGMNNSGGPQGTQNPPQPEAGGRPESEAVANPNEQPGAEGENPGSPGEGDSGQGGAGNQNPKTNSGAPGAQETNRQRPKDNTEGNNSGAEGSEAQSPSTSKQQSDSQGGSDGSQSGGGSQGGGQSSRQPGQDSAGGSTPSEEGAGAANQPGAGETSSEGGSRTEAEGETGSAGTEQGEGSGTRSGGSEAGGEAGSPSAAEQAGSPDAGSQTGGENAEPGGAEGGSSGGGLSQGEQQPGERPAGVRGGEGRGQNSGAAQPPNGEAAPGDAANEEFLREATDLAIEHLKHADDDLLEQLGWSEADRRKFIEGYERMRRAAAGNGAEAEAAKQELADWRKGLGLTPPGERFHAGTEAEGQRGPALENQGFRSEPPAAYEKLYRAFRKGRPQGRE